jgi:hypothetical protein
MTSSGAARLAILRISVMSAIMKVFDPDQIPRASLFLIIGVPTIAEEM